MPDDLLAALNEIEFVLSNLVDRVADLERDLENAHDHLRAVPAAHWRAVEGI